MRTLFDGIFSGGSTPSAPISGVVGPADLVKSTADSQRAVPKAWFTDPFALLDSLGLGYRAAPSGLAYKTLRQMSENDPIVAAIIQLRVHQVSSFLRPQPNKYSVGFRFSHRYDKERRLDAGERRRIRELEQFMMRCGAEEKQDRDDFVTQTKKLVRDRLVYDQMCTEIVPRYNGQPYEFHAIPASTMRLAQPKNRKGTPMNSSDAGKYPKYVQVIDGVIVESFNRDRVAFSVANPRTDLDAWEYGYSELEMLVRTVTAHLWAEEWNRKLFSSGSTTKGILNLKGNIPPQQLDSFRRAWMSQISGVSNAWRTPIINSNDEIQWIDLQPTNQEMGFKEWMEYLIKVACAIFLVDPTEINFDLRASARQNPMYMSNNESQQKLSQDRGLRPLLRHIQDHYNRNIVWRIAPEFEFEFVGIDAKTEVQAIELKLKELQSHKTLNEVREADQLAPVPHGDVPLNASYIGYLNQQQQMAAAQQQAAPGQGGGIPGYQGAEMQQQGDEQSANVRGEMQRETEEKQQKRKRYADRFFYDEGEEWETTYNAALDDSDLQKATEPFNDFLRG